MFLDQSVQGTGIPIEPLLSHRHRQVQLLFVVFDPAEEIPETSICVGDGKLFLGDVVKSPALPGRGFLKQLQPLWSLRPLFVKTYVFLDHFRCHFVPHRPRKVPVLPELPSP